MRYNYDDFKNISKDEIIKIAQSICLKINDRIFEKKEKETIYLSLIEICEKSFPVYLSNERKSEPELEKERVEDKFNRNKKINEYKFFLDCMLVAIIANQIENILRYIKDEEQKKKLLDWLADYKSRSDEEKSRIYWEEYSQRFHALFSIVKLDKPDLDLEANLIMLKRLELIHKIIECDNKIIEERERHISNLLSLAHEVKIIKNGEEISYFAENTEEEILNFISKRVIRHEEFLRDLADLERKERLAREELKRSIAEKAANQSMHSYLIHLMAPGLIEINEAFEFDKQNLREGELYDVKEICIQYNIAEIDESMSIEIVKERLDIFDNAKSIAPERSRFAKIVTITHNELRDYEEVIAILDKNENVKEDQKQSKDTQFELSEIRKETREKKKKKKGVIREKEKVEALKDETTESEKTATESEKAATENEEVALTDEKAAESFKHMTHEVAGSGDFDFDALRDEVNSIFNNPASPASEEEKEEEKKSTLRDFKEIKTTYSSRKSKEETSELPKEPDPPRPRPKH